MFHSQKHCKPEGKRFHLATLGVPPPPPHTHKWYVPCLTAPSVHQVSVGSYQLQVLISLAAFSLVFKTLTSKLVPKKADIQYCPASLSAGLSTVSPDGKSLHNRRRMHMCILYFILAFIISLRSKKLFEGLGNILKNVFCVRDVMLDSFHYLFNCSNIQIKKALS